MTNNKEAADIKVVKIEAGSSPAKPLRNAKFKLFHGTTTTNTTWTEHEDSTGVCEKTTGENGIITFNGLVDGFYKLLETQTPVGYNAMFTPIYFKITGGAVDLTDEDGQVIDAQPLVTLTKKSSGTDEDTFTVSNTPGVVLPSTGGTGTLIYTVAGIALIVLAGVLLVSRRKRKA